MDDIQNQSVIQKKITFAQTSEMVDAALMIMKESMRQEKLVGDTEFETVVNAVTMDAQANMMMEFISIIEHIKKGGLFNTEN